MNKDRNLLTSLATAMYRLKRKLTPTTWLLLIGFAIAMTTMVLGIGLIEESLSAAKNAATQIDIPILQTMNNTGFTLMVFCMYSLFPTVWL